MTPRALRRCARVEQWTRRGAALSLLDAPATAELPGAEGYVGAMLDERGGSLHPLNYALGLATAAQRAGAVLHGHSRVVSLARDAVPGMC